jgi:hypothetical protein
MVMHALKVAHQRHGFVEDVVLIVQVAFDPVARVDLLAIPALVVDRRHAKQPQAAAFDLVGQRADHAAVLILEERAHRARKHDHRRTVVAEDEELHVPVQRAREPLMVVPKHRIRSLY